MKPAPHHRSHAGTNAIVSGRWHRWLFGLAIITGTACGQGREVGPEFAHELGHIEKAMIPPQSTLLRREGPERGFWSLRWSWQLEIVQPAAPYREALVRALGASYRCAVERRHVRCAKTLRGDQLTLDIAAHPAPGGTLVKAELTASTL